MQYVVHYLRQSILCNFTISLYSFYFAGFDYEVVCGRIKLEIFLCSLPVPALSEA